MLKTAKVGGYQQVKYSKDPLVAGPPLDRLSSHWGDAARTSSTKELLEMAKAGADMQHESHSKESPDSNVPFSVKAGHWDAAIASNNAECDVQVKKILGVTRTSRAGLGYGKHQPVPDKKQTVEYRRHVSAAVKEQIENGYSAKAAGQVLQCNWTNWANYIRMDLRWANILALPPNLLAFSLNATFNTLPSPSNLRRMKIQSDATCWLCGRSPCTITHVLSGCKRALDQGRFNLRHDSVLKEIVTFLLDFISKVGKENLTATPGGLEFVPEGKWPRKNPPKRKGGILRSAGDWKLTTDLGEQRGYVFPTHLAMTLERPDILLESPSTRRVILIELTCPSEENFDGANEFKRRRYKGLVSQIERKGWIVDHFPIEVGARGYCAANVKTLFATLGLSGKQSKKLIGSASRIALEESFRIWLCRESAVWDVESVEFRPNDAHCPNSSPPVIQSKVSAGQAVNARARAGAKVNGNCISTALPQGSGGPSKGSAIREPVSYATLLKSGKNVTTPTGLVNKGETCYANAMLQALSVFPEYFSLCPEKPGLLKAFVNVVRCLVDGKKAAVDPWVFLTHLQSSVRASEMSTEFNWNSQNDVPAVLSILMEAINSESAPAKKMSETSVKHVKTCTVCLHQSPVTSVERMLWVPVRSSVSAMVEDFSADQILDGDNAYNCLQCGRKQKAIERSEIVSAPVMLALVLRRLEPAPLRQGTLVRNTQTIKYLSPVSVRERTGSGVEIAVRYEAMAVIHYEGDSVRGHYFAHINKQGRWFRCNDRAVTPSVIGDLGSDTAYMIFCRKVN